MTGAGRLCVRLTSQSERNLGCEGVSLSLSLCSLSLSLPPSLCFAVDDAEEKSVSVLCEFWCTLAFLPETLAGLAAPRQPSKQPIQSLEPMMFITISARD